MSESPLDSYPPSFRQTAHHHRHGVDSNVADDIAKHALDFSSFDPLPIIDLHSLNTHTHTEKHKLNQACQDWGIFRLVNHGLPSTLLAKLHEVVKEVFGLEFETKKGLFDKGPITHFWGTPLLTAAGVAVPMDFNWMEALNVPLTQLSLLQTDQVHHPLLHSFRLLLEEYGNHQSRLVRTLFESMASILELTKEQRELYLSTPTAFLRLYRYPPCSVTANKAAWGLDAHTDSSVVTILNQDQVGGLQVYKDKIWLDVKPIPNTLVVHLGDMMQAMSDDKYKSVIHRVKVNPDRERISMGYFVFPQEDYAIQSSKYKPFTYADFRVQVQQDVKTIGYKVGLKRFKLLDSSASYIESSQEFSTT